MSQIRFQVRRGCKIGLPDLMEGELGFTTDTHELFIGTEAATNVQVGTSGEIDAKVAAAQAAAAADATAKANAAQAAAETTAAADATSKSYAAQTTAEATAAAEAAAKVAAHEAAITAHRVSQVTDAVSTTNLTTNYYDKTASDSRYMPAGMSPMVAAIIFGG